MLTYIAPKHGRFQILTIEVVFVYHKERAANKVPIHVRT